VTNSNNDLTVRFALPNFFLTETGGGATNYENEGASLNFQKLFNLSEYRCINMDRTIIIKRLAFIKYLLNQANNASHFPEPLSSSSILSFHDAVELFLHLCAEQYNLNTKNISFIEYWEKLKPPLSTANKPELTQKESMRRLNDARVSLKHHGTLPSKLDIDNFRVICNTFFEENCNPSLTVC